jgi:hypothetical protein
VLLIILVAGSLTAARRMNQVAERATQEEGEATSRLFDALLIRAEAGRSSKRPGQRFRRPPRVNLEQAGTQAEFSSDARTVVVGLSDGAVVAIDLETQYAKRLAPGWPPDQLALHADGRLLAVASAAKQGVQLRDLRKGQKAICRIRACRRWPGNPMGRSWKPAATTSASAFGTARAARSAPPWRGTGGN